MSYALALFLCALTVFVGQTQTSQATPLLFTDRTAFNAAAGRSTLLTLDAPGQIAYNPLVNRADYRATYQGLMTFQFDAVGGVGTNSDGTVTLGRTGLAASGWLLAPATAFGFDIFTNDYSFVDLDVRGSDGTSSSWTIPTAGLQFLGVTSPTSFFATISYVGRPITFFPGYRGTSLGYTIDNVAIKTVPEPPSLLSLGFALLAVAGWTSLQRKCRQA